MNLTTVQRIVHEMTDSWTGSLFLSEWQKEELKRQDSESGVRCLLRMWANYSYTESESDEEHVYCNATWDNVYCWPPTPAGITITRNCSEAFLETRPTYAGHLEGFAIRVCQENGTWLHGVWTDYEECALSFETYERKTVEDRNLVGLVQHTLFYGSILSLVCLLTALAIFYHFRCLWCERVKVHAHLMLALVLRFFLLLIITEPFVFERSSNYRDVDIVCKAIICFYLFATVASVSWMFIQGLYLNTKLTTSVFSSGTKHQIRIYYFIGWVIPAILLMIYLIIMLCNHYEGGCWKGYADMPEMWILLGPMLFALMLNAVFLINILRIVLEKVRNSNLHCDTSQILAAAKATLILFPVLGINNLLLLYNPGGDYEKYYVILNTLFSATQGIFVSLVYCFTNCEVKDALRRSYNRMAARRTGNMGRAHNNSNHTHQLLSQSPQNSPMIMMVEIPLEHSSISENVTKAEAV